MSVTHNPPRSLPKDAINALRDRIDGRVLLPGEDGYDAARVLWNAMIDRSPTLIVQPLATADVQAAVRFAADHDLPIAIRGGGHNVAGLALCDEGLMIDLSRMRRVEVDPAAKTARAQGGATWLDFDTATTAHGLATTGGAISTTGIGGLTLGGGLGNLMRSYGLTCDNLIEAELVTANGDVVTASQNVNADLFWGLRGGGGNFGVVTAFTYQLHAVPELLGGLLAFPAELARDFLHVYRELTGRAPDQLGSAAVLAALPNGTPAAIAMVCYNGPVSDGEQVIKPLRDLGQPLLDAVGPISYTAVQTLFDAGSPYGLSNYWRSHFLTQLSDAGIETLVDIHRSAPSPRCSVLLENLGGAVKRVGRLDTAFNFRDYEYNLTLLTRWEDPARADEHISWVRNGSDAMKAYGSGVYVNYLGVGEQVDRVRAAYGAEKYARLVDLKNRYDPTNRFRFNQNIPPTA